MEFVVVLMFAPGHDVGAGMAAVTQWLRNAGHPYREIAPNAVTVTGPPGTAAAAIANDLQKTCLQPGDHVFAAEITANAFAE